MVYGEPKTMLGRDTISQRGREKFNKYKSIFDVLVKLSFILPYKFRLKLFQSLRLVRGNKGLALRYVLLKSLARNCGDNISIHPNVYLLNPENLSIGNNVSIHPMCYIECGKNKEYGIYIGDDVSIAHGVTVMATEHKYDNLYIPIKDQGTISKTVIIEENVWIGAKATILSGNIIKSGSIVGANAVVTKNVENNNIVGGVPARVIKVRKEIGK